MAGAAGIKIYAGQAEAVMDDKNRLTVPKKFRRLMPESEQGQTSAWLMPGYEEADFIIMDDVDGAALAQSLMSSGLGAGQSSQQKLLLGQSERVEVDKLGRVLVPQHFLDQCAIADREFFITGNGDHLMVFGRASWERFRIGLTRAKRDQLWNGPRGMPAQNAQVRAAVGEAKL